MLCAGLGILAACMQPPSVGAASRPSAVDWRGKRVLLAAPPRRIVSLAPGMTEILYALGLRGRIVADTAWCTYPPEARALPHVGDFRISVEKVVAQRPDLVVASSSANRQAVEQLGRLRIPVFALDPQNLTQTYDAIERIGKVTGQTVQARQVVAMMRARIAGLQRRLARDPGTPKVLIVVQAQPLMVAGSANFMDDIVSHAGGINVARDAGPGFKAYSPERVVIDQPDVILAGRDDAAALKANRALSALPAVRRNAVYTVDQDIVSRPGPRLAQGIEVVARLLHPRAFRR